MEIAFCLNLKTLFRKVISQHFTQLLQKDVFFLKGQLLAIFIQNHMQHLRVIKKSFLVVCDIQFYKLLYEKKVCDEFFCTPAL